MTNENGERFRLMMSDLAHEVMTPTSFSATAPIHAFIVDSEGRVRDRASLVGRVNATARRASPFTTSSTRARAIRRQPCWAAPA